MEFLMSYKTVRYLAAFAALLMTTAALGQSEGASLADNPELAQAREVLQAGRELIIREDLRMTEEEAGGFWPAYQDYVAALSVVRDRKAKLVTGFMQAYRDGEFSEEYAEWLIAENFEIKKDWLQVQQDFVQKFRKALPAVKVARFYQLENKMDAEVDAQLALAVPLVE
jgi:hypothetical protein